MYPSVKNPKFIKPTHGDVVEDDQWPELGK